MEVPGCGEAVEGSWGGMVTGASTSRPLPTARQPLDTQARCMYRHLGSLGDAQNAWRGAGLPSALQTEAPLGSAGQSRARWALPTTDPAVTGMSVWLLGQQPSHGKQGISARVGGEGLRRVL